MMNHKICYRCKRDLPLSDYQKDAKKPDGKQGACRDCMNSRHAEWQEKRRQYTRDYARKRYHENKERERKRSAEWRAANPEKVKACVESYRRREPLALRYSRLKEMGVLGLGETKEEFYANYDRWLDEQHNRCKCCGVEFRHKYGAHGPQVDHDHTTMFVRGLICRPCNVGAGYIESPRFDKLLNYLRLYNPVIGSTPPQGITESDHISSPF